MGEVHVHVGLPKTGTSSIQAALDARRASLAEAGVLYPGGRHRAQRLAAYDLLGQRVRGDDADPVAGAFNSLVEEMVGYTGRLIVVSEEELGLARPRHVRRLVRSLAHHHVHVVIGIRDMARTVVSAWQQDVVTGGTATWQDFITSVREPRQRAVPAATAFWIRHDPLRVIDAWSTEVPVGRISVMTVPPAGASSRTLLERFAVATGLPIELWDAGEPRPRNVSLGAAELEVIRRLNPHVLAGLNQEQYRFVIEHGIRSRLTIDRSRPLRLPPEHVSWACQYGEGLVGELQRRGVRVVGDLDDLVPEQPPVSSLPFDVVGDAELLEAAKAALASLALAHGTLFRRYRRNFSQREGRLPTAQEVLGSGVRAAGFHLQKAGLRRTSDNPVLAWAARTYVERTSGRRP
ncbi:MAG: hypothetical protein ACXWDL_06215 [Nocardioides sp.]